jgi:pyruvate-ferredoxin/flavodoxin oxidoreductase
MRAEAALAGRAHPLFRYDPEAGASWARRLDFTGNPVPAEDWPREQLSVATPDGNQSVLDLAFTFADYALCEPAFSGSFRVAPDGVPEGELAPLASYLELAPEEAAGKLPFVWGVDAKGSLHRLIVARRLALACRDRLGTWRTLQELAGVNSEYVSEAEARVRAEVEAQATAERERLAAGHAEELAALQSRAVERVVDRLTAALLEVDVAAFAGLGPPPAGPLAGLGGTVDEVTANLLELLQTTPGPTDGNGAHPGDPRVEQLAGELLSAIREEPLP